MKKYKLAELFCGPGGFAEGAKQAKLFTHVWVNDIAAKSLGEAQYGVGNVLSFKEV